jgi:pimeloyl-ACP methyl ester carboxylesterase
MALAVWFFCALAFMSAAAMAADKTFLVKSSDGVVISVQEAGDSAAPAIVFIHGLLGSHINWEGQLKSPELSSYRLITFDLRGHGASGKPEDAKAFSEGRRWADDLRAVLQTTKAKKPVLVGWSLGGAVISNYVAAYGDAALGGVVYVGGVVELNSELITQHSDVYAGLASDDLKLHLSAVRRFLSLCFATQPDQATFEQLLTNAATASWIMTRAVPSMTVLASEGLPKIKVPMLMLYGEKDALVMIRPSLERARGLNSEIHSKIYADSGHSPFLEEMHRFNIDLAAFRQSIPAP